MIEGISPLQIPGAPGGLELMVILLIAVLLFGANKIPKLARSTGQAMGEFKRGREEIEQELEDIQETTSLDSDNTSSSTTSSTTSEQSNSSEETTEDEE